MLWPTLTRAGAPPPPSHATASVCVCYFYIPGAACYESMNKGGGGGAGCCCSALSLAQTYQNLGRGGGEENKGVDWEGGGGNKTRREEDSTGRETIYIK